MTQASLPSHVSIQPRVPAPRVRTNSVSCSRLATGVRAGADWANHTHRIVRSHTSTGTHAVRMWAVKVKGFTMNPMLPPVLTGSR